MNKVKIITDGCCSLKPDYLKSIGVDCIAMDITVNGETFSSLDYPIENPKEFYEKLEKADSCSTSCINSYTFSEVFEKYLKQGYDVFYIGLSGGMSSTYNNSKVAADELNEKYGKRVFVADSISGSYAIGLDVEMAARLASEGASAEEIYNKLHLNKARTYAIFIPGDLKFLKRSGRISKFAASIGSMLKIVPVIMANERGELKLYSKSIGHKKAISSIQNYILQNADLSSVQKIYIGHTGQEQEAGEFAKFLKANTQNKEIIIDYIDYTMGCNCGPKTLAIFGYLK